MRIVLREIISPIRGKVLLRGLSRLAAFNFLNKRSEALSGKGNRYYSYFAQKNRIHNIIFIILLTAGLLVRINNFQYPISELNSNIDASNDYLISRHIVHYGEFPLIGPWNSVYGNVNSPLYYYLLAALVAIKDDILFLGLVNIFLQLLVIIIIYILAKKAFGPGTALIASTLFNFSYIAFSQSQHAWQPYMMQPFVNLSYLFFLLSYLKKSYVFLVSGIFAFIFAAALHNSVFFLLPVFLILAFFIVKNQKKPIWYYGLTAVIFPISFFILYFPAFLYHLKHQGQGALIRAAAYVESPAESLNNLLNNIHILSNNFFIKSQSLLSKDIFLISVILFSGLCYFLYLQKDATKRNFSLLAAFLIAQPLLAAALLNVTIPNFYFTPIFGLFVILISEIINHTFSKNIVLTGAKIVIVALLFYSFSSSLYVFNANANLRESVDRIGSATRAIGNEIYQIKARENIRSNDFFQISFYKQGIGYRLNDPVIMAPLEKHLGEKFTEINEIVPSRYTSTNDGKYVFLICYYYNFSERECLDGFQRDYRNYLVGDRIYTQRPFSIYVAKRNELPRH